MDLQITCTITVILTRLTYTSAVSWLVWRITRPSLRVLSHPPTDWFLCQCQRFKERVETAPDLFRPRLRMGTSSLSLSLLTKVKTWKQPKCPSTDEWTKKKCCTYTKEHDSTIKKNEILPSATTQVGLESIVRAEVSQRKTNAMISLI